MKTCVSHFINKPKHMQCATTPHGTDSSQIECDIPKFNACIPTTSLCRQNVVMHVRDAVFTQRLYWIIAVREIFTYRSKCYFHLTWVASRAKLYFWWFIISLDMNAKLDIFLGAVYLLNIQYLQAFQWDDLTFNSIKQGRSQGGGAQRAVARTSILKPKMLPFLLSSLKTSTFVRLRYTLCYGQHYCQCDRKFEQRD